MQNITLSRDQEVAIARIGQWLDSSDKYFVLEGPAGSGKTELAAKIGRDAGLDMIFCSYTGKAANVLRNRGLDASTLHRALYKPKEKSRERLRQLTEAMLRAQQNPNSADNEHHMKKIRDEIAQERRRVGSPSWDVPEDAPVKDAELVVVDEFSMLDGKCVTDLLENAHKVLFMGDPYQLPPIRGTCPLVGKPNFSLTEIHRTALANPITAALTQIRTSGKIPTARQANEHGCWEYLKRDQTNWAEHYAIADQTIVALNATRKKFNQRYRAAFHHKDILDKNDRVMFLRNDHEMEIYNGTTAKVRKWKQFPGFVEINCTLDDGTDTVVTASDVVLRGGEMTDVNDRRIQVVDHAFAITGHKSQGSEYDHVVVWDESWGSQQDYRRWLYTVTSRAKKRCTFVAK